MRVAYLSLPVETWWECLSYVSKRDLRRLRLVCRFFSRICFSPLFEALSWSAPNTDRLLWRPPTALGDPVQDLYAFITNDSASDVHHAVRRLDFKGVDCGFRTWLHSPPPISAANSSYLALFHQALSAFTALRSLNLTAVTIDYDAAASLQNLSFLKVLELHDCVVPCSLPVQLPLHKFVVVSTRDCGDPQVTRETLHLVAPRQLEWVVFVDDRWTSTVFSAWANVSMSFLRRLTIRVQRGQLAPFLNFLRQCPQLDSLFLTRDSTLDHPDGTLPSTTVTVPNLRVYEGPLILAHAFITGRNITSTRLYAVSVDDRTGYFMPMRTESIIGALEMTLLAAPHLRTLRLCDVCPDLALLRLVSRHIPELKTLELRLSSSAGGRNFRREDTSESVSQSAASISASDLEGVLCVAEHVGIPVDRLTGFPTKKYPPAERVLVWATLGHFFLPSSLEELGVQCPDYLLLMLVKGDPATSISSSKGACNGGLNVSGMLHDLSRRLTRLRRYTVNERVWAFTVGNEGGAMDWAEI